MMIESAEAGLTLKLTSSPRLVNRTARCGAPFRRPAVPARVAPTGAARYSAPWSTIPPPLLLTVMELARLIDACSTPAAYPFPAGQVEVRQTHISAVFLAGPFAYKVKKPLDLPFLDFSTLERRRHFCDEEVRLNRRLAPEVYLGVVPVVAGPDGPRFEAGGEPIDWAVKMVRLPDDATLAERLRRGGVSVAEAEALARRLAAFHRAAEASDGAAAFGRADAVARLVRDVLELGEPLVGRAVEPGAFARLKALAEAALSRHRGLIEARA